MTLHGTRDPKAPSPDRLVLPDGSVVIGEDATTLRRAIKATVDAYSIPRTPAELEARAHRERPSDRKKRKRNAERLRAMGVLRS